MKLLCLSAASLLAYLPCFAQNEDVAKENFLFPDDFALTLSTVEGSSESTEIRASWPAVPNALVYEIELAELYVEEISPLATALKLEDNTITGLGTGDDAGNLDVGFHVQIKGSSNGNDGTYIVAKEGLTVNSLTVSGAKLKTEILETSKAGILRIDPAQWDYFVQKKALFATDKPALHFTGLLQGAPYIARIRAVTEGDHLANVDTGFTRATLPFFTTRGQLKSPALVIEKVTTRSLKMIWLPPENAETEAIDYLLEQASDKDFKENYLKHPLTREKEKEFAGLEPETTLHFRITAIPGKGYVRHARSASRTHSISTLPIESLELTGTVSILNPQLESLTAKWFEPTNAGAESIHYTLEVAADKEFQDILQTFKELPSTTHELVDLKPRTIYHLRVTAHPGQDNIRHESSKPILGSGTTIGNKLETPANLTATSGIGTISAKWDAPINAKGDIVYYIQVQLITGSGNASVPDASVTTQTEYGPIEELEKGTEFLFSILAGPAETNLIDEISGVATTNVTTLTDETSSDLAPGADPELENPEQSEEPTEEGNSQPTPTPTPSAPKLPDAPSEN